MLLSRGGVLGFGLGALVMLMAACGPAQSAPVALGRQALPVASPTSPQPSGTVVWGRVPYCNCFAGSATANVASALQDANLTVNLKELSPRDGWLYFAVTFDPTAMTDDQVRTAMEVGGAELIAGPP